MKRLLPLLILALCLCCGGAAAEQWTPVSITDDYGFVLVISGEPRTIVSLAPTNTEILFALGLGGKVVGVTEYCNYPDEAQEKPTIGGYSTINVEKITTLRPDIIFGNTMNGEENIDHLRKLGFTVICLNPDSVEGTFHAIRTIGTASGATAEAEELISSMKGTITNLTKHQTPSTPEVVHLLGTDPYWVSGSATFQDELLTLAGARNAFSDVSGWSTISLERLITTDPDIILVSSGSGMGVEGEDILKNSIMTDPRLSSLEAVKNNRVYVMDSDTFNRGGPRLVQALENLTKTLYQDTYFETAVPATETPKASGFGFGLVVLGAAACLVFLRT